MNEPPFKIPTFAQTFMARRMRKLLIKPVAFEVRADAAGLQHAFDSYSDEKCRALAARSS